MTSFSWWGTQLDVFDSTYNDTVSNERGVELAVAVEWLHRVAIDANGTAVAGLEVGNVVGHYGCPFRRRVVDLWEEAPGVENIDVLTVAGSYPWVLSLSTIEHVCRDGYGGRYESLSAAAVDHLRSLLQPGGRMLVTLPMGWNVELDRALLDDADQLGATTSCTIVRTRDGWAQTDRPEWRPYGTNPWGWAASVWIGEWQA